MISVSYRVSLLTLLFDKKIHYVKLFFFLSLWQKCCISEHISFILALLLSWTNVPTLRPEWRFHLAKQWVLFCLFVFFSVWKLYKCPFYLSKLLRNFKSSQLLIWITKNAVFTSSANDYISSWLTFFKINSSSPL